MQVDNSPRKWEARSIQLPRGTPEESRWRHLWKTVAIASGSGPRVTVCQQGQQLGTRASCRQEHKTRWDIQTACVCLSLCYPPLTSEWSGCCFTSVLQISCKFIFHSPLAYIYTGNGILENSSSLPSEPSKNLQ